jgi:hypothetical protein
MIIESGIIITLGLLFLFIKMPRRTALYWLGKPLTVDIAVSVLTYMLHWGTFTGVMAAAFAGMATSILTTAGRVLFGYIDKQGYHNGYFHVRY